MYQYRKINTLNFKDSHSLERFIVYRFNDLIEYSRFTMLDLSLDMMIPIRAINPHLKGF